jgi:chemotaxis protein methyltransferase CheR
MNSSRAHIPDPVAGIAGDLLAKLSIFIATHMGLHFPVGKWRTLERGVISAAREFGFEDPESYIRWIMSSPLSREQIEILASHLTIGETYFLREKRSLEVLREDILPETISARRGDGRQLRIWSAGCSTGEEPFSVAILLDAMGTALRDWNISIIATDINPRALGRAAEGVYGGWSFRNPPPGFREKYFRKTGDGRFEILPQFRGMVSFSYLNLAEDVYPSLMNNTNAMDVILCRNVLMYFTPELAKKVVERFHRSLVDGGCLIVSPCEASQELFAQFKAVNLPDAVFYRKQGAGIGELKVEGRKSSFPQSILSLPPSAESLLPPPQPPPKTLPPVRPIIPREQTPYEEALALYERGLYPEAEERLAVLLQKDQGDVKASVLLCRICANQGKLAEARMLLERAISADKLNPGLHYLHAMVLQEQGAVDGAIASLKRALYLDQDLVLAHFSLANLALRQGKNNEARKHFGNCLELLGRHSQDDILPESEGITAGRLTEIIRSMEIMGDRDEKQGIGIR